VNVGAGSGDGAAGPPPRVRAPAGDADRERLIGLLREHYAQGNLDDAEFDRRTGVVLSARYADEAAAALAGLPLLAGREPGRRGQRSRGRHAQADRPAAGWVPTAERFRDPTSRAIMRVWIDPADDSRHYVPEPPP
jgi:DUF1707 SHOCT-like domain